MSDETLLGSVNDPAAPLRATLSVFSEIIQIMEGSRAYTDESIDSLPGVFAMIDPKGRIFRGNQALARLMEQPVADNIRGRNIRELFSPEVAEEFLGEARGGPAAA
jgi:PAS domain-containing protein